MKTVGNSLWMKVQGNDDSIGIFRPLESPPPPLQQKINIIRTRKHTYSKIIISVWSAKKPMKFSNLYLFQSVEQKALVATVCRKFHFFASLFFSLHQYQLLLLCVFGRSFRTFLFLAANCITKYTFCTFFFFFFHSGIVIVDIVYNKYPFWTIRVCVYSKCIFFVRLSVCLCECVEIFFFFLYVVGFFLLRYFCTAVCIIHSTFIYNYAIWSICN